MDATMASKSLKPIIPSLKEKTRYISFEVISENPVAKFADVSKSVWQACLSFMGESGASAAGLWILPEQWDESRQSGVLRVSANSVSLAKASLSTIKSIGNHEVIVRSVATSGMINKL